MLFRTALRLPFFFLYSSTGAVVFLAFFDFVVLLLDLGRDTPGKRAKRAFSNVDRNRQPC